MAKPVAFEISRSDLEKLKIPTSAIITDVKTLSSYNWIEAPKATPTIAVPGSPALWSAPGVARQLKKDSGLIYTAQNAARHPESPLEPLFRAIYTASPSFDVRSTDIVTDRNNIRKLLAFIDPSTSRNVLEAFSIAIEVTKNTAIFCRQEAKAFEYVAPHEFKGFGHEFEKAYTSSQIRGSTGHHRIITYRFSDLNFIVRHETDGYVNTARGPSSSISSRNAQDELSSMLGALSLSSVEPPSPGTAATGSKLLIKEEGQVVPLESTLEIKTRVIHKPLDIDEIATQLWVSQTPKLVRAYHRNGTFPNPVVEDVAATIKSWENRKQNELRKLAVLIRKVIKSAQECGGNAMLKYDVKGDKLVIRKVDSKPMLPKDLYLKWHDDEDHEKDAEAQEDGEVGAKSAETIGKIISVLKTTENGRDNGGVE